MLDDVESVKTAVEKKQEEIASWQDRLAQDNAEFKGALELLDVQTTQARELIEAELGKEEEVVTGSNPFEYLRQYYKTVIEELKRQLGELQKKIARGDAPEMRLRRTETAEVVSPGIRKTEKDLNQALEEYQMMVFSFITINNDLSKYRRRKMESSELH